MSKIAPARKRNRSYGKRSPLDRMAAAVQSELRTRCQSDEAFREMRDWLWREHRVRTSIESLSQWWQRQQMNGWGETKRISHGGFEIVVTAPGASEVRVRVLTLPTPRTPVSPQ